jgi:hypothetical protein
LTGINEKDWKRIFGDSKIKSYNFFKAMEDARLPGTEFAYLEIYDEKKKIAILPCFTYRLKLDVLASPLLKNFLKPFRRLFPNFLSLKVLCAGSFASTCEHYIGILDNLNQEELNIVKEIINTQLKEKSRQLHAPLVFIKEIPQHDLIYIQQILSDDFYFYDSLPTSFIPVGNDCEPYPVALRKKERKRYRTSKDSFDDRFSWEIISDFKDCTKQFELFYLKVLEKSKTQFEVLNERFFHYLNKYLMQNSFILVAKDKLNQIKLMELVIEEKDRLIPLYLGINYPDKENTKVLYFNTIFRTVEEAEKRKKTIVVLGQTSYYPKVLSGAFVERVYLGFYSYIPVLQFLIKNILGKLFMPTKVMDNSYNYELERKIKERYSSLGFEIYN